MPTESVTEETVYGATAFREIAAWDDVRFVLRSKLFEQVGPRDGYPRVDLQHRIMGDSVVMLRGEDHAQRRHLESVLFRRATLLKYEQELVRPRLAHTLARLTVDGDGLRRADLNEISRDMLLALMATLTGVALETPEQERRFDEVFARLDRGARVRHAADPEAALRDGLAAQQAFAEEFFAPAWARHQATPDDTRPNDLITMMLRHAEHFAAWDPEVYLREATLYVSASVGTTTRELCLAVDAIERWIEAHPADAALRTDEDFLGHAFEEALRVHQSIPSVGRVAVDAVTLPSGVSVEKGETVRVNLQAAGREAVGPGGEEFDPHRRAPDRGERHGLAFSDGRHVCIGKMLVLGDRDGDARRLGTAKTALMVLYGSGMRRDRTREPALKDTITKRFESYPVVFGGPDA